MNRYMYTLPFVLLTGGTGLHAWVTGPLDLIRAKKEEAVTKIHQVSRFDKRLQTLEKEQTTIKEANKRTQELLSNYSTELDGLRAEVGCSYGKWQQFLNKKLSLLSQMYQIMTELDQIQHQAINLIDMQEKAVQESATDTNFTSLLVVNKSYYTYADVQDIAYKLAENRARLTETEKTKIATTDDLVKRKKSLGLIQEEYKDKKRQQEGFSVNNKIEDKEIRIFSVAQIGDLVDLQVKLAGYKKDLAELKVIEAERELSFAEDKIISLKAQIKVLDSEYIRIQRAARVSEAYVKSMEEQLEAQQQIFVARTDRYNEKLRLITSIELEIKQKLQEARQKFSLTTADVTAIQSLNKEPKKIIDWESFTMALNFLLEESLLGIQREHLIAQIDFEKAQFKRDELEVAIVGSWRKMTAERGGFTSDNEVEQEIRAYLIKKSEFETHIATITNARDLAINSLSVLNASFEKIKPIERLLCNQAESVFRHDRLAYDTTLKRLYEIEEKIRGRINWNAQLIQTHSSTIGILHENSKRIDTIISELKTRSFWRRSEISIRWGELKNFIPELKQFVVDVKNATLQFFSQERLQRVWIFIKSNFYEPLRFLLLLLQCVIAIIMFFLLKLYIPDIVNFLQGFARNYPFMHYFSLLIAVILSFVMQYLESLYLWLVIMTFILIESIRDASFAQLFYLLSLPFLLYLVYQFFAYFKQVNEQYKSYFMSEMLQKRFFFLVPKMCYVLVVLFCLHSAFTFGGYTTSQVPAVLMALIFILVQITLISLLGKEQILGFIGSDTPLRQWIYEHVSRYYYVVWCVVVAIIIMSNPYVGYGRQVLYIISRLLLTGALIPLLLWLHNRIKRASIDLFFYYTENDEIKERFVTGRFTYGVFVVSSLILFIIVSVYVGARIWGSDITLHEMSSWLHYPFYTPTDEAGNEIRVTMLSMLQIVAYVFGGIAIAYVINQFVIRRVLDPFLATSGVQNTMATLIRYVIVIIAVFMGLTSAGLEGLTTKLAILLAGIGFAAQEAVRDFFSYFVILVQRPVKIGDLIEIIDGDHDENRLRGVVRHITPRSIMIRRNNSMTVIIPNSRVIMNPIINWSYSKNFIAFDDILVTVSYASDPEFVRKTLLKVLETNQHILKSPAPIVRLEDFVDNGYRFLVRGFLTSDKIFDQWDIASEIRLHIVVTLRQNGIELASPVRTLRMLAGLPVDKRKE